MAQSALEKVNPVQNGGLVSYIILHYHNTVKIVENTIGIEYDLRLVYLAWLLLFCVSTYSLVYRI